MVGLFLAKSCLADFLIAKTFCAGREIIMLRESILKPVAVKGKQYSCPCWLWTLEQIQSEIICTCVLAVLSHLASTSMLSEYRTTQTPSFFTIANTGFMILVNVLGHCSNQKAVPWIAKDNPSFGVSGTCAVLHRWEQWGTCPSGPTWLAILPSELAPSLSILTWWCVGLRPVGLQLDARFHLSWGPQRLDSQGLLYPPGPLWWLSSTYANLLTSSVTCHLSESPSVVEFPLTEAVRCLKTLAVGCLKAPAYRAEHPSTAGNSLPIWNK